MSESKNKYLPLHMETIDILSFYNTAKERFIDPKPWKSLLAQTDWRSTYTEIESLQEMVRCQIDESYEWEKEKTLTLIQLNREESHGKSILCQGH